MTKVVLLLAFATVSLAQFAPSPQPSYGGPNAVINIDNTASRTQIEAESGLPNAIHQEEYYEWEGYDGWYNNPAHPEWGGAGECSSGLASISRQVRGYLVAERLRKTRQVKSGNRYT